MSPGASRGSEVPGRPALAAVSNSSSCKHSGHKNSCHSTRALNCGDLDTTAAWPSSLASAHLKFLCLFALMSSGPLQPGAPLTIYRPHESGSECWGAPLPVRMPKPRCNPVLPVTGEPAAAAAAAATMTANQRPVCCKRRRTPASNLPSVVAAQLCDGGHQFNQALASALFLH